LPSAVTASGAGTYCGSTTITAANGGSGTIYFQGTTSGGTLTVTSSSSQVVSSSGTYYFRAQSAAGCWGTEGSVAVTISPLPAIGLTVGGAGAICSGTGTNITVVASVSGTSYQLRNGVTSVGSSVAGTGGTINLPTGNLSSATTFNVLATLGSCSAQLTQTAAVSINPLPTIGLTVGGAGAICSGTATNITVALSVSGTSYQLRDAANNPVGSSVAGTGGTINLPTGNLSSATTFNVLATLGSCSAQLTQTAAVTINPRPTPSFTTSPGTEVCAKDDETYITQSGQSSYVWSVPGNPGTDYSITSGGIGSTSYTVILKWLSSGSKTVTVNYSDTNGCTAVTAASSTITVHPLPVIGTFN